MGGSTDAATVKWDRLQSQANDLSFGQEARRPAMGTRWMAMEDQEAAQTAFKAKGESIQKSQECLEPRIQFGKMLWAMRI